MFKHTTQIWALKLNLLLTEKFTNSLSPTQILDSPERTCPKPLIPKLNC